jgi:hypothetical protein
MAQVRDPVCQEDDGVQKDPQKKTEEGCSLFGVWDYCGFLD